MGDIQMLESIKRIETAILNSESEYSYHDYLIASMVIKGFKIRDCYTIARKHILMCDFSDMNISIALKNHIHLFDISNFNDNQNLAYVMNCIEKDESLGILNSEIKSVLEASRELVDEITYIVGYSEILEEEKGESIEMLFDEDVQKNVHDIIEDSFDIFRFFFSVDLLFTREDGSQLLFNAELAGSKKEFSTGFSGRPVLPDDAGMWYEFGTPVKIGFVTKNVCRGLSVAYVGETGIISEIKDRKANDSEPYHNEVPVTGVLEVPKGWFKKNEIKAGDHVRMKTIIASY